MVQLNQPASSCPRRCPGEKPVVNKADLLDQDTTKARALLAEAGFPDGQDFPRCVC